MICLLIVNYIDPAPMVKTLRRLHEDVIKRKHFPQYWPFVRGIHRWPVTSHLKGQWRGALMFSLIWALNKRLSKQSWGWWFDTPSHPLWRHCNAEHYFQLTHLLKLQGKPLVSSPNCCCLSKVLSVHGLVRQILRTRATNSIQQRDN